MVNRKTAVYSMLFCMLLVYIAPLAGAGSDKHAREYTSITTGRQVVINQNIQDARQKAEQQALGVALQNAFSSIVPGHVLASNLDFFYDRLLSRVKDYMVTYKVLGEIENKGYYLVGVESKVDLVLLEKTLVQAKILSADKNRPVVLLFISEQKPSDPEPLTWWTDTIYPYHSIGEQILVDRMIEDGFMVFGNNVQRPDPAFYNIEFLSQTDTEAAIELGLQMKADMILFGSVVSQEAINRMGEERTFNARMLLDGYNTKTKERVVQSEVEAVVKSETNEEGNTNAIVKAAALSAQDVITQLDTYWAKKMRIEHAFDVRIQGDKFHPRYLALTKRFKQMPGIENMQPKEMGADYGVIELFYKGEPTQFANALMLKTFDDFGFEFLEVSEEQVYIRLIDKADEVQPELEDENSVESVESTPLDE